MPRAILFDFDGTLADTIPAITEGINLTMRAYGFPTHTEEEVRSYINNGPRKLIQRALPKDLQSDEALLDRVLADYNVLYADVCEHTDRPYDGILALLRTLRSRGYKIGVLSNKQDHLLRKIAEGILPDGLYDTILGTVPNKPTKPDPAMTLQIARALDARPEDCIIVGDSDVDVKTAKAANMMHVGVSWGYRDEAFLRENGAVDVANTPEELLTMIEKLMQERISQHD